MAVTMSAVRAALDVDEPQYAEAAKLGPQAVPHLEKLVREGDPMLASKATYLASLIQSDQSIEVVKAAAQSADAVVRVAAAAAARNMPGAETDQVLAPLMADPDAGVRKAAGKAAGPSRAAAAEPAPRGSAAGGPAPPESGGGSVDAAGQSQASDSPDDASGAGGGSTDSATDEMVASEADGGGSVDGSLTRGSMVGEGGGSV